MTITGISEIVRGWLGWCPNAHAQVRTASLLPDRDTTGSETVVPSGRSFKARAIHWLGLFRNQAFLMAIWFSGAGIGLSIAIGGADAPMFFTGIVAGTLLSVYQGIRFWKTMNEVREQGAVFLASLYDKTTIAIITLSFMIPMVVFMGAVPGIDLTRYNSIIGGFIFIMFWWLLLVVWVWESQTKCLLQSDGMMLELARES